MGAKRLKRKETNAGFGFAIIVTVGERELVSVPQLKGLFEGLKAYRKEDGNILLFRPEKNALWMRLGAEHMCVPPPSCEQFVKAVQATVLANKHWVPPFGEI